MKRFAFAILAAAVTIALASCEKEKEKPESGNPEIINSEVVDTGQAGTDLAVSTITSPEGDTLGTTLSYTSWIKVRTETKAASEKTVEVVLNDTLRTNRGSVASTSDIQHSLDAEDHVLNYRRYPSERHDGHVIIVDSVMHYMITLRDYELMYYVVYQVATYDDGFSRQVMPYHRPEVVGSSEVTCELMDTIIETDDTGFRHQFFRYKISHSLTVRIAGQDYTMPNYRIVKQYGGMLD